MIGIKNNAGVILLINMKMQTSKVYLNILCLFAFMLLLLEKINFDNSSSILSVRHCVDC